MARRHAAPQACARFSLSFQGEETGWQEDTRRRRPECFSPSPFRERRPVGKKTCAAAGLRAFPLSFQGEETGWQEGARRRRPECFSPSPFRERKPVGKKTHGAAGLRAFLPLLSERGNRLARRHAPPQVCALFPLSFQGEGWGEGGSATIPVCRARKRSAAHQ